MTDDATGPRAPFPDPVVTANVYCDRRLDEAMEQAGDSADGSSPTWR